MKIAAIEAGGTKFVVGIVDESANVIERVEFPTTTPRETMKLVINYLKKQEFSAIGLGCFGPIDLKKTSNTYGYITSTPKVKWRNFDIVGRLKETFSCPIGFDTDVNVAALGELEYGAARDVNNCIYLTVGTGIGGGVIVNNTLVNGLLHPEMGHILVRRHKEDKFESICPYHENCLEGLASGPSIEKRWNEPGIELKNNEEVWKLESYYLAQGIMNFILTVSPERVIIGGGVMKQKQLYTLIRENLKIMLNGYIDKEELYKEDYIVEPLLGDNSGILGCACLAIRECKNSEL